jgi:hypothetical protein
VPRILSIVAVALLLAVGPSPATADHRDKESYKKDRSAEQRSRAKKVAKAKRGYWKRYRVGNRTYRFYYSPVWGPFAGPPGLW